MKSTSLKSSIAGIAVNRKKFVQFTLLERPVKTEFPFAINVRFPKHLKQFKGTRFSTFKNIDSNIILESVGDYDNLTICTISRVCSMRTGWAITSQKLVLNLEW